MHQLIVYLWKCAYLYDLIYRLGDENDDIRAIAASTLVPMAECLARHLSTEKFNSVLQILWKALLDIDDLSSSTGSIMDLLARLYSIPSTMKASLAVNAPITPHLLRTSYFPRLFPLFRHTITSVRKAVLRITSAIVSALLPEHDCAADDNMDWLHSLVDYISQNLLLEEHRSLVDANVDFWERILKEYPSLAKHIAPFLPRWIHVLTTTVGQPLVVQLFPIAGRDLFRPRQT